MNKLSDIEKQFVLEDYKENSEIKIKGVIYRVVSNDLKQLILEPISSNLLGKQLLDMDNNRILYRRIENGKIVETEI